MNIHIKDISFVIKYKFWMKYFLKFIYHIKKKQISNLEKLLNVYEINSKMIKVFMHIIDIMSFFRCKF
jgi:hypothetical protein